MRKLFSIFAALTLSVGLWAANSVITYTASAQLTTTDAGDGSGYGVHVNLFFDANGQVLPFTQSFDASTQKGTMTFNGELKTIGEGAFFATTSDVPGVSALYTIVIPEGVTTIEGNAFVSCNNLTSVTIPSSITTIGACAFGMLKSLTDFTVSWTTAPLPIMPTGRDHLFLDTNIPLATLHVPSGSKGLYSITDPWNLFGSIEEFVSQAIKDAAIADVNAKIAETDNDNVKTIATNAATAINAAMTEAEVNALKNLAIANIASAKAAYGDGEAAGYNTGYAEGETAGYGVGYDDGEAAVRATLPTEGYEGPAVIITKGEKVLTLFNPEKVEYQILEAD